MQHAAPTPKGFLLGQFRDVLWRTRGIMPPADGTTLADDLSAVILTYRADPQVSDATLAAWRTAVLDTTPISGAPWQVADTLDVALTQAMAAMQTIIDAPDLAAGTLTAAQLSAAARQTQAAVKVQALLLRRLVRAVRSDLSGSN